MSHQAIEIQNLGKLYRLGQKPERFKTLGGALSSWVRSPLSNLQRLRSLSHFNNGDEDNTIWALKDVSFNITSGEVVGIIGRNGAGKSTLLKIISRITEPTQGRVVIRGTVSSLLEVGTGFHLDLTGRENVYLNGAILGMSKKEIDRKFDEIVAFAEVEKFIDTPVKFYSSGMKVRLAFSVAAHLEPDILIIDEVLAVGDVPFQKKCLGKMEDVSGHGRTVLFVSHNLSAVRQLCKRCVVLENGVLRLDAETDEAVNFYHELTSSHQTGEINRSMHKVCDGVRFTSVRILNAEGQPDPAPRNFAPIQIQADFEIENEQLLPITITFGIDTFEGVKLTRISTDASSLPEGGLRKGKNRICLKLEMPFAADLYTLVLRADQIYPNNRTVAQVLNALTFTLQETEIVQWKGLNKGKQIVPLKGEWSIVSDPTG